MQESIHARTHAYVHKCTCAHTPHPHTIVPSAQQLGSSCKLLFMFISLLYIQVQLFTESVQVLLSSRRYGLGGKCLHSSHNHIQGSVVLPTCIMYKCILAHYPICMYRSCLKLLRSLLENMILEIFARLDLIGLLRYTYFKFHVFAVLG